MHDMRIGGALYGVCRAPEWGSKYLVIICLMTYFQPETSVSISGWPIQETGQPPLFKGLIIGTCSYIGADSATKKRLAVTHLKRLFVRYNVGMPAEVVTVSLKKYQASKGIQLPNNVLCTSLWQDITRVDEWIARYQMSG
jgi:hypothetical protein